MNAVYGVSRPCVLIKKEKLEAFYDLPLELKLRLEQCRKIINQKISHAFEKENYSSFYIASRLENNKMRYVTTEGVFSENEIIIRLEQCFYTKGETEKTKL